MEIKDFTSSIIEDFNIALTTGYTGFLAGEFLYSAKNYTPAINETVAVDFAHIHSYLGKRSLVVMKNAGLNEALLPIINSCILGTNAGMVLWVVDDLKVEGSEIAQNSQDLVRLLGIEPKTPKNWNELYSLTREAYVISEDKKLPQIVIITNDLFKNPIEFSTLKLEDLNEPSDTLSVLHPKTAKEFIDKFSENAQIKTTLFPQIETQGFSYSKLLSSKYENLFKAIPKSLFDIIIGDFGTYTLASGSPIQYGLHYGGAIASGIGAYLADKRPLVIVGEGGLTSGFEATLELIRKQPDIKIIVIENGGISGQEPLNLNLLEVLSDMKIPTVRINQNEMESITSLLSDKGQKVIMVQYSN